MSIFKSYECQKCAHVYEGLLDVCARCGGRAVPLGGIRACLSSRRPPGYAGGKSTPHSARSYDKLFKENFEIMGISNLYHREGVPVVTRKKNPRLRYNTMPEWAGAQQPITSYAGFDAVRKAGVTLPPMMVEGKPFNVPNVHPEAEPGAQVGRGLSEAMRAQTIITHRDKG
jgi:hypothetical protein